jgi:hypothetical protein
VQYRGRYSRSRSRSPPQHGSNYDPPVPAENRYMGLGSRSDEFDSFRKSRSQAYSKREPYQAFICYKCNKVKLSEDNKTFVSNPLFSLVI